MPYIGNQPGTGTRNRFIYTATASQTTFTGADDNGKTLKYSDSDYVDVYLNGICLVPVTDYTSTSKTSIVLIQAASLNDTLEVVAYDIATISDTVSKADGGTFEANVTFADGADIITATAGTDNVRLGEDAGASIASGGIRNVLIGKDSGTALTTGDNNTFVGAFTGDVVTTGTSNTAIGFASLSSCDVGNHNTAVGHGTLNALNYSTSTDGYNTAVGSGAGELMTTATSNTLIGGKVGDALTTGVANVAMGGDGTYAALGSDTQGKFTVAIGVGALRSQNFTSDTQTNNVAIGYFAGGVMTTGTANTFVGSLAGDDCVDGQNNVAVGNGALSADAADGNTAVGKGAATGATGSDNVAIGKDAGAGLTDGGKNTLVGNDAGYYIAGGNDNTVIGQFNGNENGLDIRNENDNIVLSDGDGRPRAYANSQGSWRFVSDDASGVGGHSHTFAHDNNDTPAFIVNNQHGSFNSKVFFVAADKSASSAYHLIQARSGGTSGDIEFFVRGDGDVNCDLAFNAGGADYAEYFEWSDGNSDSQDRTGYTVVLDGNKIKLATSDDTTANIIGAVSANPSMVGDADIDRWKSKYLVDDFGAYQKETYTITEWTETVKENTDEVLDEDGNVIAPALPEKTREVSHAYETDKIPDDVTVPNNATVSTKDSKGNTFERRLLNPDYNPDTAYVSRKDRKEWATIGMMGKLRIRKGQPTGDRWIKMRDISDNVEEWLVR